MRGFAIIAHVFAPHIWKLGIGSAQMDEIRIHKEWTFWSFLFLTIGIFAVINDTVFVYERVKGIYEVSRLEDSYLYWLYTTMYLNAFIFGLVLAGQEYYPYKIWKLMYLGKGNKVRCNQVLFYGCILIVFLGFTFFIAKLASNA